MIKFKTTDLSDFTWLRFSCVLLFYNKIYGMFLSTNLFKSINRARGERKTDVFFILIKPCAMLAY